MPKNKWIREYKIEVLKENFAPALIATPNKIVISSIGQDRPLNIKYKVVSAPDKNTQSVMSLSIFGLSETNTAFLHGVGSKIIFSIGYRDQPLQVAFSGLVTSSESLVNANTQEVRLQCTASQIGSKPMPITFPKVETHADRIVSILEVVRKLIPELNISYAKKELRDLVADEPTKAQASRLFMANRTLLTDKTFGTYTSSTTARTTLVNYCRTFNIDVAVTNDEVHLVRNGGSIPKTSVVPAELGANLLSPPRRKLDNTSEAIGSSLAKVQWEMTLLAAPEVTVNSVVQADHVRKIDGAVVKEEFAIKVVSFVHTGTYYGNTWHTSVLGSVSGALLNRTPLSSVAEGFNNPYIEPIP